MSTPMVAGAAALGFYVWLRQTCSAAAVAELPLVETHTRTHTAPDTWSETLYLFKEALRYMYQETFGRWHAIDLFFGLAYLSRKGSDRYPAADIAAAGRPITTSELPQDQAQELLEQLQRAERYMLYCQGLRHHRPEMQRKHWHDLVGTGDSDILHHSPVAGLLRPAYVIVRDRVSREVILCVRGTHSRQDMFTSLTGTVKPHHVITPNGVVLGYSHLGMLAAARWLMGRTRDLLLAALRDNPGYQLRVVGHSMGGGTAAMLTMMLRERVPGLAGATAVAIACPACMTRQLAAGCADFVTTLVHGTDIVPTFSSGSIDALREEVIQSSWFTEFQADIRQRLAANISSSMRGLRLQAAGAGEWTQRHIIQTAATSFRSCYSVRPRSCYSLRPAGRAAASASAGSSGFAAGSSSSSSRGFLSFTAGLLGAGRAGAAAAGATAGSSSRGAPLGVVDAHDWWEHEQQQQLAASEREQLLPRGANAFLLRFMGGRGTAAGGGGGAAAAAAAAGIDDGSIRGMSSPSEAALVERALEACLLAADTGQLEPGGQQQQYAMQQQAAVAAAAAAAGGSSARVVAAAGQGGRRPGVAGQLAKVASRLGKRPTAPGKKDDDAAGSSVSSVPAAAAAATSAAAGLPVSTGAGGSSISAVAAAAGAGDADASGPGAAAAGAAVGDATAAVTSSSAGKPIPASLRRRGWMLGDVLAADGGGGWVMTDDAGGIGNGLAGLGGLGSSVLHLGNAVGQTGRLVLESTGQLLKGSTMFQACAVPPGVAGRAPPLSPSRADGQQHRRRRARRQQPQQQEQQQPQQQEQQTDAASAILTTAPGSSRDLMRMDRSAASLSRDSRGSGAGSECEQRSGRYRGSDDDDGSSGSGSDGDEDGRSESDPDLLDHDLAAGLEAAGAHLVANGGFGGGFGGSSSDIAAAGGGGSSQAAALNEPAMRASISVLLAAASSGDGDGSTARRHAHEEAAAERLLQESVAAGVTTRSELDLLQLDPSQQQQQAAGVKGVSAAGSSSSSSSSSAQEAKEQQQQQQQQQQDKQAERKTRRQMYPAGRILHLMPASVVAAAKAEQQQQQDGDSSSSGEPPPPAAAAAAAAAAARLARLTASTGTAGLGDEYVLLEVPHELYGRMRLCPSQVRDHFVPSYLVAVRSVMAQLQQQLQQQRQQQQACSRPPASPAGEALFMSNGAV